VQVEVVKVDQALASLQQEKEKRDGTVVHTKGTKRENKNVVPQNDANTADNSGDELTYAD